ncbi:MAG: proline--tRNA ligase, partial [Bdellovibrionales bacterium]|nr:proline--tRNA ligase [Bdellovibrionales bacterium]
MRWTQTHIFTLKEAPADAEIPSHKLLVRAGMIKKLAPGIHTLQNLALRSLRKIETIIREELDKRGCTEVLMPMVHPKELWQETNRWSEMGDGLLKFKNRNGHDFCLGATHEEAVTDIVRHDVKSYRDLPRNLYQIQTKYRDEIRPRFGLMRGREFIMKDAYSFDRDPEGALKSYDLLYEAYRAIFDRMGLDYRIVKADAGNIGGSKTHEFQVLAGSGEDHLMVCDTCQFAANIEVAEAIDFEPSAPVPPGSAAMEEFETKGLKQISTLAKALKVPESELVKTLFFADEAGKPFAVICRGNDEINPIKLKNLLKMSNPPLFLTEQEIKALTGAYPGSCGPQGLNIPIYMEASMAHMQNFVVGANKDAFHVRNVVRGRDFKETATADLRMARAGDRCPDCKKGKMQSLRGIEVGHVFYLGTKYSKLMNANYLNEGGQSIPIEMGCYGIGVTRTMQASVEQNHDKDGIIWPAPIAPYHVHIALLDPASTILAEPLKVLTEKFNQMG